MRPDEAGTRAECALGRLETGALRLALAKKVRGAPGPDGITADMLRHVPEAGWTAMAEMLRAVEDGADWPEGCTWVRIAVLAKPGAEGAPEPGKVRLIAVESLPIRCWATARAVGLMPWLEYVIGKGVIGGRCQGEALHAHGCYAGLCPYLLPCQAGRVGRSLF